MNLQFRHLLLQEQFLFDNILYTKTNYQRGYYLQNGQKIYRRFKKDKLVEFIKGRNFNE